MACDPSTLLSNANCILDCLSKGQMDAVSVGMLCNMANTSSNFVLKAGDTMTGSLLMTDGANTFRTGLSLSTDMLPVIGTQFGIFLGSSGMNEVLCRYSNDSSGASLFFFKTRSVTDTTANAILVNGDNIGIVQVDSSDGASYRGSGSIAFAVDAVPGVNDVPGRMEFKTAPNGGAGFLTRWTVKNTGLLTGTRSLTLRDGTAIPAGGTAGVGYMFSSTANFGAFFGSGAPALSAAQGSMYLRSDGSGPTDRAYINTDGAGTWTAITTVA